MLQFSIISWSRDIREESKMWKTVLVCAIFCGCGTLAQKLKVSVYYGPLCSDSVRFLVNDFYPTYQELGDSMDVDLVPYGKATTSNESGSWEFDCQFGEEECHANKVHSCAVGLYPITQSTEFIVCSMNSTDASSDAYNEECATYSNISWTALEECLTSGQADDLLAANGRRTHRFIPDLINFVPTIVFNDVFSSHLQSLSYAHFRIIFEFFSEQMRCDFCHFNDSNGLVSSGKFIFGVTLLLLLVQKLFVI